MPFSRSVLASPMGPVLWLVAMTLFGTTTLGQKEVPLLKRDKAFANHVIATDLQRVVATDFFPDGRLLLGTQNTGEILIADVTTTPITTETYMVIDDLNKYKERGLLGMLIDNNFPNEPYIYIYYSPDSDKNMRLSRFTHFENAGDLTSRSFPTTEKVLWKDTVGYNGCCHFGGGLEFGPDGYIYWSIGDQFTSTWAQDLTKAAGKILRIAKDGSYPSDNIGNDGSGPNVDAVWAYGLRNPFGMHWDLVGNRMFIAEVGGNDQFTAWEDIHMGIAGQNYGWPHCEGPCDNPDFALTCDCAEHDTPLYAYKHFNKGACVIGGPVYRGTVFPKELQGAYIFGDYVRKWLKYLTFNADGSVKGEHLLDEETKPLRIFEGPDGAVYYTTDGGELRRIMYSSGNLPPVITNVLISETGGRNPLPVEFEAEATDGDGDKLVYTWVFDNDETKKGRVVSKVFTSQGRHQVYLKVSDDKVTVLSDVYTINVGELPKVQILSPKPGLLFVANDIITLTGAATHTRPLKEKHFHWEIKFWHNDHFHPALEGAVGRTIEFEIANDGHDYSGEINYIAYLTVEDDDGLRSTASIDFYPKLVKMRFSSQPPGEIVFLNHVPIPAPFTVDSLIGFQQPVKVASTICRKGSRLELDPDLSNLLPEAIVTTGTSNAEYHAVYRAVGSCGSFPHETTGLIMRYRADHVDEAAGLVLGWHDLSDSGNDLFPVGAAPKLVRGRLNGHEVVAFDGLTQSMGSNQVIGMPENNRQRTVMIVARYTGSASLPTTAGFSWGTTESCNSRFGVGLDGSTGGLATFGGCAAHMYSSTFFDNANWHIHTTVLKGNQLTQRVDGQEVAKDSNQFRTGGNPTLVRLGSTLDDQYLVGMEVAELLVYSRGLGLDEVEQLEEYLADEYDIFTKHPVKILSPVSGVTVEATTIVVEWNCDPAATFDSLEIHIDGAKAKETTKRAGKFSANGLSPGVHTINIGMKQGALDEVSFTETVTCILKGPGGPAGTTKQTTTTQKVTSTTKKVTTTTTRTTTKASSTTPESTTRGADGRLLKPVTRISCGASKTVQDEDGRAWSADAHHNGGKTFVENSSPIEGTKYQSVIKTERHMPGFASNALRYNIPEVPNGVVHVVLHFCEVCTCAQKANMRTFDVYLQGLLAVKKFDIVASAGWWTATSISFDVVVSDGSLQIELKRISRNPKLNGIEVYSVDGPSLPNILGPTTSSPSTTSEKSTTTTTTSRTTTTASTKDTLQAVHRINCGGQEYVDSKGQEWKADHSFNTGKVSTYPTIAIKNTADQTLYQSERFDKPSGSDLKYVLAVPSPGKYFIRLHFSELFADHAGERTFHILIQNELVRSDFDIYKEFGPKTALYLTFEAEVTDKVVIRFKHGSANNPKVNALEVLKEVPGTVPTSPPAPSNEVPKSLSLGDSDFDLKFASSRKHFKNTFVDKVQLFINEYKPSVGSNAAINLCGKECVKDSKCQGFSLVVTSGALRCIGLSDTASSKKTKKTTFNYRRVFKTTTTTTTSVSNSDRVDYSDKVTLFQYRWGTGGTMFSKFRFAKSKNTKFHLFSVACDEGYLSSCLSECEELCATKSACLGITAQEGGECVGLSKLGSKTSTKQPRVSMRKVAVELKPVPTGPNVPLHMYAHYAGIAGHGERFSAALIDTSILFHQTMTGTDEESLSVAYEQCKQACFRIDDCEGIFLYISDDVEDTTACNGLSELGNPVVSTFTSWSFSRQLLPFGHVAPLQDYELDFSASDTAPGKRFGTAYSKSDRLFSRKAEQSAAETFEQFNVECARSCSADTACEGFFSSFSDALYKCWGLSSLGSPRSTTTPSSSFMRVAEDSTTTASNQCVMRCANKYSDDTERTQCTAGCRAILNFAEHKVSDGCEPICKTLYGRVITYCIDGCEGGLDIFFDVQPKQNDNDGFSMSEFTLAFHHGQVFSTIDQANNVLFKSQDGNEDCLRTCYGHEDCHGVVVYLEARSEGMKCYGLSDLGTAVGLPTSVPSYSYAKEGLFNARAARSSAFLANSAPQASVPDAEPVTHRSSNHIQLGLSVFAGMLCASLLVVAVAKWRGYGVFAPKADNHFDHQPRPAHLKSKMSDINLARIGLNPASNPPPIMTKNHLMAPRRMSGLRARTPSPTSMLASTV